MAARIVWSPTAIADVVAIVEYIERDSPPIATRVAKDFVAAVDSAADHPLAGRIVPEFGDTELRERIVYPYRVIYRVTDEAIFVIAVIHGRRLLARLTP